MLPPAAPALPSKFMLTHHLLCTSYNLAVTADADAATIKRQYYRLARQWHPDKNAGNAEATAKFQLLGEAYQVCVIVCAFRCAIVCHCVCKCV